LLNEKNKINCITKSYNSIFINNKINIYKYKYLSLKNNNKKIIYNIKIVIKILEKRKIKCLEILNKCIKDNCFLLIIFKIKNITKMNFINIIKIGAKEIIQKMLTYDIKNKK
jgi:hypothetical protein